MGEEESDTGEINQAKVDSEAFQKKENARKAAEAAEKAAAEAAQAHQEKLESRNSYTGLIHHADGTRWDAETDEIVGGVNNYQQVHSKHKHIKGLGSYHEPKVRSWHLEKIGENESVDQAMDRQEELDKAEKKMNNKKHHNLKTDQLHSHKKESHSSHGHKHHKKHHAHVQAEAEEKPDKPITTNTDKGTTMDEDAANESEVSAAKQATEDAARKKAEDEAREAARKKEEEENRLWPDGLVHKEGVKIYKPDNQIVGGVNLYS